jgi:hypothetical protein
MSINLKGVFMDCLSAWSFEWDPDNDTELPHAEKIELKLLLNVELTTR